MVKLDITENIRRATCISTGRYIEIYHDKKFPGDIRINTDEDSHILTQFQCVELIEQLVLTLRRSMELLS